MIKRLTTFRLDPYLLLLGAWTLLALSPLLAPGYFYSAHDGRHSVFYIMQFDASLRDGALFPRWAMHHIQGYGYPTFIIQAPLGFYLAEIFVLLGAGYTLAAKLTWAAGFLAGAWGMYRLVAYWLGLEVRDRDERVLVRLAAVVAGLMYVYAPYHVLDIYVRAALNDSLLLAWFPWVFLAFDRLVDRGLESGWQRRLSLAILVLAGILLTHTFALISFTPLLMTFVLFRLLQRWRARREAPWRPTLLAGAAGVAALLLSAAFLVPLLVEGPHLQQQVYVTESYDYRNHFVWFGQFFSPFWGAGFSDDPAGANDGMGFQLGLMAVLFLIFAVFLIVGGDEHRAFRRSLLAYLAAATVVILFLMMPASSLVWSALPMLAIIQFPWRLLALTAFTASALVGVAMGAMLSSDVCDGSLTDSGQVTGAALAVGLLIVFGGFVYVAADLQPVEPWREDGRAVFRFEEEHPDMLAFTEWVQEPFAASPMSDEYRSPDYVEEYGEDGFLTRLAILGAPGEIISQYSRGSSAGGIVDLAAAGTVRIHVLYFPGWRVTVDGAPVPVRISEPHGLLEVEVPAGRHRIDAAMSATPARTIGSVLSWGTLLGVAGLAAWPARRRRRPADEA